VPVTPDPATDANGVPPRAEGLDGETEFFAERLAVPPAIWVVAIAMTASLGIAYGYYLGTAVGLLTFVISTLPVIAWFIMTVPVVRVDDRVVRAGRARLPLDFAGDPVPLDAQAAREARGPRAHPAAYTLIRSWVPRGVIVPVLDTSDPHPYWYISTRRPEALCIAILDARAASVRATNQEQGAEPTGE